MNVNNTIKHKKLPGLYSIMTSLKEKLPQVDMEVIPGISSELVNGGKVCFLTDCKLSGVLPANIVPYHPEHQCKAAVILSNMLQAPVIAEKVPHLRPKTVYNGITLALAEEEKVFTI